MRLLGLSLILILLACNHNMPSNKSEIIGFYHDFETVEIEAAQGFMIDKRDSCYVLKVRSLSSKFPFYDSLIIPVNKIITKSKTLRPSWKRFACQSATHITFLNALGKINNVVGLCDMQYLPKDSVYEKLISENVIELNQNNEVNLERLVLLQPDLFLTYPFEWKSDKYQRANINTLLVAEYLEQTPVARLEWIKFFGILVNERAKADSIFKAVKTNYQQLCTKKNTGKTVFFNLPFKDQWNMPASNSLTVNLAKDVGLSYIYQTEEEDNNDNLSFSKEAVWHTVFDADYWIIIAGRPKEFTLQDLLDEEPVYKTFKAVKEKQVLFCNTSHTGYFTKGILEPHIMLKDLLYLTNQLSEHQPVYFKLLK